MNHPSRIAISKIANSSAALLAGCAVLLGVSGVSAQDWPQWRGPNRDGKVTGFSAPQTWPTNLTQKWKAPVGIGDSTPALAGDKLFTLGREDANEAIRCFDAATGKVLWQEVYPAQHVVTGPPARHPGPRSSPVVADGKVCALGVGGILTCLDTATGKVVWRKQSTEDYQGVAYDFDSSMSPLVVDGRCIVHIGGKGKGAIFAFDLASGELKWKSEGDAPAQSSPVVMTVNGQKQLVTISAKNVLGVSLADGKQLWQVPFEAQQGNNTTPVIDGQTVIYTGQSKGITAVKIEAQGDGFTATNVWAETHLGSRFTTPILKDGKLYGYNGHFFCIDAKTGATLWTEDGNRGNSAALLDAGSVILALTVNGDLTVFKPSDKEYAEVAKFKVGESETWAHPVVAGKRIFIRDRENVALWTLE